MGELLRRGLGRGGVVGSGGRCRGEGAVEGVGGWSGEEMEGNVRCYQGIRSEEGNSGFP